MFSTKKIGFYFRSALVFVVIFSTLGGGICDRSPIAPTTLCPDGKPVPCNTPVTLTVWQLFDDQEVFDSLFKGYQAAYPNVTFVYKKMSYADYEENLLRALASGKGPDIFQIHNDWLPKHKDNILPIPTEKMSINDYEDTFVDVASQDFIYKDKAYAIPLSVDTLALYYNTRMIDEHFLSSPPTTWTQLEEYNKTFCKKNNDIINISGATLGNAKNINRASDILYAMMLQRNTVMTSPDNSTATFSLPTKKPNGTEDYPGLEAFKFYTSFADKNNSNYCWNENMLGSIEAFEKGQAAMTINYSYQKPAIDKFKDNKVRFGISKLPQINTTDDPISYANYWGETVSKNSKYSDWAWDFLISIGKNAGEYSRSTGKPTALKNAAKDDTSDVFNNQAYYAKSFYKTRADEVDKIFANMIDAAAINGIPQEDALRKAESDISKIMLENKKEE